MKIPFYMITMILLIAACRDQVLYSAYQTIPESAWGLHDEKYFEVPVQDTLNRYNLYIMLRNNQDYPYANIYLITGVKFPDNTYIADTLEYQMTDEKGRFLGNGFGSLKENKLIWKENIRFRHSGTYKFSIKQAMRERQSVTGIDPLPGVSDVGIQIEKIQP